MFDETGLEGPILTSLGELSALSELVIVGSDMTGTIPTELGMLSRLTRLVLVRILSQLNVGVFYALSLFLLSRLKCHIWVGPCRRKLDLYLFSVSFH